jgi:hypothetical protein
MIIMTSFFLKKYYPVSFQIKLLPFVHFFLKCWKITCKRTVIGGSTSRTS